MISSTLIFFVDVLENAGRASLDAQAQPLTAGQAHLVQ